MATNKLTLITPEEMLERWGNEKWQEDWKREQMLREKGFDGDDDCVALGLEEMEGEMTMEDATKLHYLAKSGVEIDRRKAIAIPISSATPEEARDARRNEDEGDRPEYYSQEEWTSNGED